MFNCYLILHTCNVTGDEDLSCLIRLKSIFHGVSHFSHYVDMLKEEFSDIDTMKQYICTVASNDSVFSNRPQNKPDISELATYI